jgi:DNA-binding FadR family transcriptional regulator
MGKSGQDAQAEVDMGMTFEPIQKRKLYQEVLERLRARIETGEIKPGDQLPSERELMEAYSVGRVAVREALQDLARSGIVEISHGERARVVTPTARLLIDQIAEGARHLLRIQPETLDHLKEARLFLETGMVRIAAEKASPADIQKLQERLESHRASLVNIDQFMHQDMLFHREIAHISGNPIFPAIVEALFNWASANYKTIVRAPGAESLTLIEHQKILDAIAMHDADSAVKAMSDHLNRANILYRANKL